jgi:disease resistance protein RPS2
LGVLALQHCLLYFALFPEDYIIEREGLIGYLIDEGIIKGIRSRKDAFDEGHTMLNRLESILIITFHSHIGLLIAVILDALERYRKGLQS